MGKCTPDQGQVLRKLFLFPSVHMNGRIYDPHLGRFLQADPFVQFPNNTQSYNRYSYVLNNPLRYTDPSGYFLKEFFNFAYNLVQMVAGQQWLNPRAWADLIESGLEFVDATEGGGGNVMPDEVASGAFGNGATNGNISYFGPPQSPGCAYSPMNCGGTSSSGPGRYDRVIVESILGGTRSEMTGRKFANGAGAVGYVAFFGGSVGYDSDAQKGDGFFKGLWKKATAWHFEKRHAANGSLLSMDVAEEQGFYGGVPADFHQDGVAGSEIKLVHADGREMIYDGVTGEPIGMERAGIMGTYNYVSMPERPAAGAGIWANVKFGASFVVRGIGHGVTDVLPYKVLGGNVRGSECAVNNCAP